MTVVPPSGNPYAPICILGTRPGRDEAFYSHQPFTGESGQLLWRLLGIPRTETYTTNVRRDFSPSNPTPTDAEIREALPALTAEINATKANVVLALGSEALKAASGFDKTSIETWRGSPFISPCFAGKKVIATFHPTACLYGNSYNLRYVIEHDLRKAKHEAKQPELILPQRTFHINPPFDDAVGLLEQLGDPLVIDIETFADKISCLGFASSASEALCIPFLGPTAYSQSQLVFLWRKVDQVLRSRRIIGQNIQFDTTRLERLGFQLTNLHHDTMLAHHLLWTELGMQVKRRQGDRGIDSLSGKHSLAFISSIYTREPYYKHESELAWTLPGLSNEERFQRYWTYNCKDVCVTYESYEHMQQELVKTNQLAYYNKHVMGLIRPVMRMQERGMLVDGPRLAQAQKRIRLETALLQLQLNHLVGFQCNVKSPLNIAYLIHDQLAIPRAKVTKLGKPKTDEETLRGYAFNASKIADADIFKLIIDIRERRTLLSSFLSMEIEDGRYKANYLIHGTDSGRLSSRAARKGPQLQNIPKATRSIFIAAPGAVFIQGDLARAEAMFVAYDAQCEKLISIFNNPTRDLYSEVATRALDVPVSKDINSWARELFKRSIHGTNYKMGPLKLVGVLRLAGIDISTLPVPGRSPMTKAEHIQGQYLGQFPEIVDWQTRIGQQARTTRILVDAFGRRRVFLGRPDDALERAACSYRPQATVVGITNLALQVLDAYGWALVAQTHDSVMLEVPEDQLPLAAKAIQEAMSIPITLHERTFQIPVDISWGKSWGKLIDYANIEGVIP